eukprot:gene7038-14314_t
MGHQSTSITVDELKRSREILEEAGASAADDETKDNRLLEGNTSVRSESQMETTEDPVVISESFATNNTTESTMNQSKTTPNTDRNTEHARGPAKRKHTEMSANRNIVDLALPTQPQDEQEDDLLIRIWRNSNENTPPPLTRTLLFPEKWSLKSLWREITPIMAFSLGFPQRLLCLFNRLYFKIVFAQFLNSAKKSVETIKADFFNDEEIKHRFNNRRKLIL